LAALAEEILDRYPHRAAEFNSLAGRYDRALWTHLQLPDVFDDAAMFARADALSRGRYWVTRNSLPRQPLEVTDKARESLRRGLTEFYWNGQLRGSCATVEHYRRASGEEHFFVYLDDYPDNRLIFNDRGELEQRTDRSAFDHLFVFDPSDGTLSLYAQGGKKVQLPLQQAFCRALMGIDVGPFDALRPTYRLDHLLDPTFPLAAELESGVTDARLLALSIEVRDMPGRRLTLEADPNGPRQDIYDMIDTWVSLRDVPSERWRVTAAKFRVSLAADNGERPRTMTFSVRTPHSCDLRSKPDELQSVGQSCLRRWEIVDA
jgi:hypothetical protein